MHDFSSAAAEQDGSSKNDFLDAILRERPDLRHELAYFPGQGRRAHTVFIGDEVFKTPKEWYGFNFDEEYATLQRLEGQGLPVPEVTCVGKEFVFYGMTRLPGNMLTWDALEEMGHKARMDLAKEIAAFCVKLSEAVSEADARNLEAMAPKGYAHDDERYFMHADLAGRNVLYDPVTKKLSGIVDFGGSRFTDLNDGFVNVRDDEQYPEDFKEEIFAEYKRLLHAKPERKAPAPARKRTPKTS